MNQKIETPIKQDIVDGRMQVNEFQMKVPNTFWGKVKVLLAAFWGKLIFIYLRIRFSAMTIALKPLADHLEKQVFPGLREKRVKWLTIKSGKSDDPNRCLAGQYEKTEISFPGMERFCSILTEKRINSLQLNTHLERNQIIETMLILLWVLPVVESCGIKAAGFWTWNRKAIAGGMLTSDGFHRFCADMKLDLENRIYKVDYTYCELFMAKLVKNYALVFSSFSDHRAYFSLAPVAAIVAFILFSLPVILMLNQFEIRTIFWLPAIALPPVAVWLIMHVFGAMQYDMEHRTHLLDEYTRREKVLARFPEVNPNPIYKISKRGEIVYVNPAATKLLENAQISKDKVESVLPINYLELSEKSLVEHEPLDVEFTFGEKVFRYLVSPFIEDQTVLFAGNDITYLRKIETDLRDINANLESLVRQRTKEVELTQDATITCLASLAEVRDPETGEHIERTRTYVRALAVHLKSNPRYSEQLDDRTIELLFNSAPLHDIGKVGIPDSILLKPGSLTDDEFTIMKRHTDFGADALKAAIKQLGFDSFLNIALEIAKGHHERWDGSGYPEGLKGEEIPLSARLMALADVYDALISKRVYKPAFPHEKAKDLIVKARGAHFDPAVVDAFVEIEEEFKDIAAQFPD